MTGGRGGERGGRGGRWERWQVGEEVRVGGEVRGSGNAARRA